MSLLNANDPILQEMQNWMADLLAPEQYQPAVGEEEHVAIRIDKRMRRYLESRNHGEKVARAAMELAGIDVPNAWDQAA